MLLYNMLFARMAELADAHGSGPCDSNIMRVQVPFPALIIARLCVLLCYAHGYADLERQKGTAYAVPFFA